MLVDDGLACALEVVVDAAEGLACGVLAEADGDVGADSPLAANLVSVLDEVVAATAVVVVAEDDVVDVVADFEAVAGDALALVVVVLTGDAAATGVLPVVAVVLVAEAFVVVAACVAAACVAAGGGDDFAVVVVEDAPVEVVDPLADGLDSFVLDGGDWLPVFELEVVDDEDFEAALESDFADFEDDVDDEDDEEEEEEEDDELDLPLAGADVLAWFGEAENALGNASTGAKTTRMATSVASAVYAA
ncbi:MAG: hypothetical protein JO352_22605 [Chloroflexi bacterium]|nr:hypothetical protein [Chloroflexota bacterium]MBV9597599.1 hypothetical protein [Chloroflexota bacterium]